MNDPWDAWERLAKAAAAARRHDSLEMPFGFDTRVVARWRDELALPPSLDLMRFMRVALGGALAVMLLCLALYYRTLAAPEPASLAIANSALRLGMLP
jgi:hypothetical protein